MKESFLESSIFALGKEILAEANGSIFPFFSKDYYNEKLMHWGMQDEAFKNALFKLIEVLPTLHTTEEVVKHIKEYLTPVAKNIPWFLRWSIQQLPIPYLETLKAKITRWQINLLASRFIVKPSLSEAANALKQIWKKGMAFTLDLLGESVISHTEAQRNLDAYIQLIHFLHQNILPEWRKLHISNNAVDPMPLHVSLKLSALYPRLNPISRKKSMPLVIDRLSEILAKARVCNCAITIDMEDYALKDYTLEVVEKVFLQKEFLNFEKIGIVIQAYLRESEHDLNRILKWASKREAPMTVRLVKGAYWDFEMRQSQFQNSLLPVWREKHTTDYMYEKLTRFLLDNYRQLTPAIASHNVRSLCHAVNYARLQGIDNHHFELQGLYGMADSIKAAFVQRGYLVREYVPVGSFLTGMAYLVRRLLENTSNQGFLCLQFQSPADSEKLLAQPFTTEIKS